MVPLGIPHSQWLAWDDADRELALAFRRFEAEHCSGCGTHPDDWARDPDAFIGDLVLCPGCQRLEEEVDNIPEGAKGYQRRLLPRQVAVARVAAGEGVT